MNLTYHELDLGVPAQWSFQAISHVKGPWDGLAGCVKREATLESLKRPVDIQILTPEDFFNFFKQKLKNIHVEFISNKFIEDIEVRVFKDRFVAAKPIKGT